MESKNIVRVEKNKDYTIINNTSIQDTRLSWKAKAIHVFMLSKPDDWNFYDQEMQQWAKDGKDSFATGLAELKKLGYVRKERQRKNDGKFDWVTVVYEVPQLPDSPCTEKPPMDEPQPDLPYMDNPSMEKPYVEKPSMENPQLLSTDIPSTELLSTNKQINNNDDKALAYAASKTPVPTTQNAFEFFEQNHFGALGSLITGKILAWIDDMSEPLVIRAMEKAVILGKTNWGYVETILKDWWNKKLLTLEAVEAEDLRWKDQRLKAGQQQNRPRRPYQQNKREEKVPDWFHNRNNDDAAQSAPVAPPLEQSQIQDFEAQRQKILAKLGKAESV